MLQLLVKMLQVISHTPFEVIALQLYIDLFQSPGNQSPSGFKQIAPSFHSRLRVAPAATTLLRHSLGRIGALRSNQSYNLIAI